MKKIILIFLSIIYLFGFNNEIELFDTLFQVMLNKKKIKVYTKKYTHLGKNFIIVNSCKEADIVLGELNCSKPRFVLDYYTLKSDKNAIGGFYWRKGRPQLRLRRANLEKYNLFISKEFEDYLE